MQSAGDILWWVGATTSEHGVHGSAKRCKICAKNIFWLHSHDVVRSTQTMFCSVCSYTKNFIVWTQFLNVKSMWRPPNVRVMWISHLEYVHTRTCKRLGFVLFNDRDVWKPILPYNYSPLCVCVCCLRSTSPSASAYIHTVCGALSL